MTIRCSLGEFAAHMLAAKIDTKLAEEAILKRPARWWRKKPSKSSARTLMGGLRLSPEPLLAKRTVTRRCLKTGEMRDSIHHHVDPHEPAGYVGSNSKIAVYQELGTDTIPPRSFLAGAAMHKEHEIHELAARVMAGVIMRNGQYYRECKIVMEELHKAAHRIKEFGEELVDDDENKRR